MPDWAYDLPTWQLGAAILIFFEVAGLGGLWLTRRFILPHLKMVDGNNDAVSGTVQAIGVFYAITVGLIAAGAYSNYQNVGSIATQEAASIAKLYRDVRDYPDPPKSMLQDGLKRYTEFIINEAWPAQRHGVILDGGTLILNDFQDELYTFEPRTEGQKAIHTEALRAYNELIGFRRQRIDAVGSGLPGAWWAVIWFGAAISIFVGYFFYLEDPRIHIILVALMAAFISLVILVIASSDNPYRGSLSIGPDSYKLILDTVINKIR
ncbi:MAG: DUF4239 domain-containing protein [Anaerolineae bacterium]